MEPLKLVKLSRLMNLSKGSPKVKVGIIDGPIDFSHPDFIDSNIITIRESDRERCKNSTSFACQHGTLVTGIIASKRGSPSPAICPNCTFIINPIFSENQGYPTSTPERLATAIVETIDAGANIINLSAGLSMSSIRKYNELEEAIQYAIAKKVLLIVASGNQGKIAITPSFNNVNFIIVTACDSMGLPSTDSNLGGKNSLSMSIMAPGVDILTTVPNKGYLSVSGSSIATPFITGTIALVFSLFPNLSSLELKNILSETHKKARTIIPPLLDAEIFLDKAQKIRLYNQVNSEFS